MKSRRKKKSARKSRKSPQRRKSRSRLVKSKKRSGKKYLTKTVCENLRGLKNVSNSCYMDSVLFLLLAIDNTYIREIMFKKGTTGNLKKIRNALARIVLYIRRLKSRKNSLTVTKLRTQLANCPISVGGSNFSQGGQEDAGEFLQRLVGLFNIYPANTSTTTFGTNSLAKSVPSRKKTLTSKIVDNKASIVHQVNSFDLQSRGTGIIKIRDLLKSTEDSGKLTNVNKFIANGVTYDRRLAISQVDDSPYLVFYIMRQNVFGPKIDTRIKPAQQLTLPLKKTKLKFSGVVLHSGSRHVGHYYAYFRCGKIWYSYDDLVAKINLIGSFKTLMSGARGDKVMREGTLYFYT